MRGKIPGFTCEVGSWCPDEIDEGTLTRSRSPLPCFLGADRERWLMQWAEGPAEFDLLKGKITDANATAYLKHRNDFFGSDEEYRHFAAESDRELDQSKGLRRLIEFDKKGQEKAQAVFYRWVRKAYFKKGVTDVPTQIRSGGSDKLVAALAKVKAAYKHAFKSGGFNPRPMKDAAYRYRLGTISDHALGTAIDVEPERNPILSDQEWKFIEKFTGKWVDRSLAAWKKDPKAVWTGIKALNDDFVTKVATEVRRIREEQAKTQLPPGKKAPDPLAILIPKNDKLRKLTNGFFTLDWELVEAFHDNGFRWGATFGQENLKGSADLHHFELSD